MLGGAAGDALGGLGQITSATQMSLFTAEGLLRGQVRFWTKGIGPIYSLMVGHSYLRWVQTQIPDIDVDVHKDGWLYKVPGLHANRTPDRVSIMALKSLRELGQNQDMTFVQAKNNSRGCGGVIRIATVGLATSKPVSLRMASRYAVIAITPSLTPSRSPCLRSGAIACRTALMLQLPCWLGW
jgi:ADP-ribosylglycohydrolase